MKHLSVNLSKNRRLQAGFTLVEVIVACTILAFATFGILGLLRLSDYMTYRAKADAKVAMIFRARVAMLSALPFATYQTIAGNTPGAFSYQEGVLPVTSGNPTTGFPFIDNADPFVPSTVTASTPLYLLSGKPFPGTMVESSIFPYKENVYLTFSGTTPSQSAQVAVTYTLTFQDTYSDGQPTRTFTFSFTKYDPASL